MKEKRMSKRNLQAAETKRKIFEAADQLAKKHGIESISVDSIVETAGVSKGAFYVHFESKDALIVDLVNEYTHIADLDYKSFFMSLSDNKGTLDILNLLAERIANYIENNIGYKNMRILYKAHLTKSIDTTSAINYSRELYKVFEDTLQKGVLRGELREDIPVEILAKHMVLAIRGVVYEWCIRFPDFDLRDQLLTHFKIVLYGLKK